MNNPNVLARARVSGTRFIESEHDLSARVSFSASCRDQHHRVTGTSRSRRLQPLATPIDTPADESCVVCAPADLQLAEMLFERWNNALQTRDPRQVTACYAPDAVLLPTVSNLPRTCHEEISDYFHHFLEKQPVGTVNQRNVKIGCNKMTDAGTYTFRVVDNGEIREVPARYTFVYENRNGQWLIVHHHSSMMPE